MHSDLPLAQLRPRDDVFYVSRSRTVLATSRDGFVHGEREQGLFVCQTRLLSVYRYWIDGGRPEPVGISNLEEHRQIAYYVIQSPNADESLFHGALGPGGRAATEAIELCLRRSVGDGLQEEVSLTNHTQKSARFTFELEVDADFADATEAENAGRQTGRIKCEWHAGQGHSELTWTYNAEHEYDHQGNTGKARLERAAKLSIEKAGYEPAYETGSKRIRFPIVLEPHGEWRALILVSGDIDGRAYMPMRNGQRTDLGQNPALTRGAEVYRTEGNSYHAKTERFLSEATCFEIGKPSLSFVVGRALEQARRDIASLRLFDLDQPDEGWTMAAGLPVYIAFFGRDALTSSWQAALLGSEMMRGTLAYLAETQATEENDWRDAQPGRLVHQMETGPKASLFYNPNGRYYGSLTGPGFYPVVLSNLWHWTGDRDLARRFLGPAFKGLAWLDQHAKRDDGFYEYRTRSEQGVKNQAWKDSSDAIVYPDGTQVPNPIAPTEFQAFVFAAKVRMSELTWWLGEKDASRRLFDEAMELRARFNDVFWMDDEGCFGMGLGPKGELIRSVGSETGHAIAAGIVHQARAAQAIERLFQPDLFSGWGVRTLSAKHRAFNPFSYHRGSVWPAEQAAFCMGLMRYGVHDRLHQLAQAQFEAAALFEYCRLPELFGGHARDDDHPIPALYPHADSPQAWSASAVPCMIQALLGLFPYAPLRILFIDPHLPAWLPELCLRRVRVGDAVVDLRFRRKADGSTDYQVLKLRGTLHVIRQPSPWSQTATFAERLVDVLASALPGH